MKSRALTLTAAALSVLGLSFSAAAVETYSPGSANDPRIRAAQFLGGDERYYSALTELLKLQRGAGPEFEASSEYWTALAEYQLSFGMRDRAEALYRTVAAAAADPLVAGRARLRLAEFEYERGYLDESRASLLRAREKLPEDLEAEWFDLYSRVLMAQGRYNEAVTVLEEATTDDDDEKAFLRYNLGVALINDGRLAQGRTALDRVGRYPGDSELIRALRDRANTTLGWHFLSNQLGGSAKPVLLRVRSVGPYSNRALLGVGWAELAPKGQLQTRGELLEDQKLRELNAPFSSGNLFGGALRRGYLDDPYERAGIRSFRRSALAKDEEEAMRRAILVWSELIDRDPQDPAVQESWLAVPFALDRLGAYTQAAKYYEQAVERLDAAHKRNKDAIQAVKGGRMVETIMRRDLDSEAGWRWELRDLPDAPETYALQTLIAEHRYAEALKNYRDVRLLTRSMDGWKTRMSAIDVAFRKRSLESTVEPTQLFARAKRNSRPQREKLTIELDEEVSIAPPGSYSGRAPRQAAQILNLKLSAIPAKFDGPVERVESLKTRTSSLKEPLAAAAQESAKRLRDMGLEELNAQKSILEKYIVEARFALARIYDGALPDADQDEFELDDEGKPIRKPKTTRGEFEVDKSKPLDKQLKPAKPAARAPAAGDAEVEVK